MSLAAADTVAPTPLSDGPPFYVITIPTWITDRDAAIDLAVQISENLASNDQVDGRFTTVGVEERPLDQHERIYADQVCRRPERA
jgi:hypothetical protein